MTDYAWTCNACSEVNPAGTVTCLKCGCPGEISAVDLDRFKRGDRIKVQRKTTESPARTEPDYAYLPLSSFIRGPLVHTPQGIACLASGGLSLLAGLVWLLAPAEIASWRILEFGWGFFFWPIAVFLAFVETGIYSDRRRYQPSVERAITVSICGLVPFVLPFLENLVA